MPFYEYLCSSGHRFDVARTVDERDNPLVCPRNTAGLPVQRVLSVPTINFPRRLFTQWYDVYDRSPREMARDPSIERYDPGARPDPGHARKDVAKAAPITTYLPTRDEVSAYVATKHERLTPVEGEVPVSV